MQDPKYVINFYLSHDRETSIARVESNSPYFSVHAGDYVDVRHFSWEAADSAPARPQRLVVVDVEHTIYGLEELEQHQLFVYLTQP